ncbi:MAG: DNA ligase [Helicobacteraceae bacterium]|nr:DNA ligase [Helicobacteraceae bacterium]
MKFLLLFSFLLASLFAQKPELLLLKKYSDDINVTGWVMSEKLDGVRAFWDGKKLISRSGKVFNPPKFFTENFPPFKLDGELWSKRENFEEVVSIVNRKKSHNGWNKLTYNIFEVPDQKGNLYKRLEKITNYVENHFTPYLKVVPQITVNSTEHLKKYQKQLELKGAEGLVVRDPSLVYFTGRSSSALKVKTYIDDECEVVGYTKGNGKYDGVIGSLMCRMQDMNIIKIGSGLSDYLRAVPPSVGTMITFKYYGLTNKGNPKFPIFMRVRN